MKNGKKIISAIILGNLLFFTIYVCLPPNIDTGGKRWLGMGRMGTDEMYVFWSSPNVGGTFQYRVYSSLENNIGNVKDMVANGTMLCDWTWNINKYNVSYSDGYYFNVMVKNPVGLTVSYRTFGLGGSFYDLSDALKWMNETLAKTDNIISLDLEKENKEVLGLIGLTMMQTNETLSAEIMHELDADYVMVYFGHLLNGLGGNEQNYNWQYLMDVCNENTLSYVDMGLEQENWYGDFDQVNTVFDEAEYFNSTSGLYEDKWFDSILVKLMFNGEATNVSSAHTQIEAFYAQELEGDVNHGKLPRVDDNGGLWSDHIPVNGSYTFDHYESVFNSTNRLFKIYRIDYSGL